MKWIGMSMVLAGCIGMGLWYSSIYIKKWKMLLEIKKALIILKGEISYGKTPLPDAFYRVAEKTKGTLSAFFRRMSEELEKGNGTVEQIWGEAIKKCISDSEIRTCDRKELEQLGSTLGYLDVEMQLQTIGLYEKQLEQSILFFEKEKESRMRLYPLLGTMGGVLICIIMI